MPRTAPPINRPSTSPSPARLWVAPATTSSDDSATTLAKLVAVVVMFMAVIVPSSSGCRVPRVDATASREPTWDRACHIQGEMFRETSALGGLEIQLVFYRGFGAGVVPKVWVGGCTMLAEPKLSAAFINRSANSG